MVQWGTVAQFISSLSVAAAFYIIIRDRRSERRRQANQVSCFMTGNSHEQYDVNQKLVSGKYSTIVMIHNSSSNMITTLNVYGTPKKDRKDLQGVHGTMPELTIHPPSHEGWRLPPGQDAVIEINTPVPPDNYEWKFDFVDALNRNWNRNLETYKLRRTRYPGPVRTKLKYWYLKYVKRRKFYKPPKKE